MRLVGVYPGEVVISLIFRAPCCVLIGLLFLQAAAQADTPQDVFIIPHTHWEGAVYKTRSEYLEDGLPHILKALYLLKKYPNYRFTLDQMCYVRPFLERYPAEVATVRQFLAEGRLQIVGGTHTMHDTNMPSGESIARQFLLAKTYFRERLGYDVTTGWALDTFGHNAQMPQILTLAGMTSYWFMRGVPRANTPSAFQWSGLDGTRIAAVWLPLGYHTFYDLPGNQLDFDQLLHRRADRLAPFSRSEEVLLSGYDVTEPSEALPERVAGFNESGTSLRAHLAVPADFEAVVAKRTDPPVIHGEFNPVGQGIYSSRIELKQAMRQIERRLATAEALSVIASVTANTDSSPHALEPAWEALLFNEEHDPAAGSVVDKVYREERQDYSRARHLTESEIHRSAEALLAHVDTTGAGVPYVVFNDLGWRRTDVAQMEVSFSDPLVRSVSLVDAEHKAVPIQFMTILKNGDGGIRQARIAFIARDIPAMGYATYHVVPNAPGAAPSPAVDSAADLVAPGSSNYGDRGVIENEFYRLSVDLKTAALTSLVLKENSWEALAGPANVVARENDGGDFWELKGQLTGGIVGAQRAVEAPNPALASWSDQNVGFGVSTSGPVFSEFRTLSERPFGKNRFATQVRLYNGLRRIEIRTDLTNEEALVRYRAIFPTSLRNGAATYEIPFGAIARPLRQEFPAQNWVDYGDGKKGLAILNRGLPGHNVAEGTLMLSLMRSAQMPADLEHYLGFDPGGSEAGLGVGQTYVFEYALVPHTKDWRAATLWRSGLEFNSPLLAFAVASHPGDLPSKWGVFEVSHDNVVVSALKPAQDGMTVLRVYEAAGAAARGVTVSVHRTVSDAYEANLLEDQTASVRVNDDKLSFDLRPWEIKTFKFRLRGAHSTQPKGGNPT